MNFTKTANISLHSNSTVATDCVESRGTTDCMSNSICTLCVKNVAKYTCPRCNISYCSLKCYQCQEHLACSENFYQDCVLENLKDINVRAEDRQQVLDMLSRLEEEHPDLDSDDDEAELADRLTGLDLDNDTDQIWSQLTDKEKLEFKDMLRDGRLANLVEVWTPWWHYKDTRLVKDAAPNKSSHTDHKQNTVPQCRKKIPDIHALLKTSKPSSDVKYNLVNVLYAYSYIVRLYNGGHLDTVIDSTQDLMSVCGVLQASQTFSHAGEAIQSCMQYIQQHCSIQTSQDFSVSIIRDVINIITGSSSDAVLDYTMAALSDLHSMLHASHKNIGVKRKGQAPIDPGDMDKRKQLFGAMKKVEFFLSWTQRYGMALHTIKADLEFEFCSLSSDLAAMTSTKKKFEQNWKGKRPPVKMAMIQELT